MCFTAKINNPIKNNTPATEIQLDDRLITNKELKDFFLNTPKRLDIIEKSDDVSDNLDVLALVDDVAKCITDVEELQEGNKIINESLDELQTLMGERQISGTVQYRLNEVWNSVFGTDGLITFITDVHDELINTKNIDLPNMQHEINSNTDSITLQKDAMDEHDKRILVVENKTTQIDVNTANIEVIRSLVNSLQAQIEQIRSECNNTLASYEARIIALEQRTGLI